MKWLVLVAVGAGAIAAACSSDPPANPNCPSIDASSCNAPIPSYASEVAPILDQRCNRTCHAPGVGPWPLVNYDDVHDWTTIIGAYIEQCGMPPPDSTAGDGDMTYEERVTVLDWLACGAPNN